MEGSEVGEVHGLEKGCGYFCKCSRKFCEGLVRRRES